MKADEHTCQVMCVALLSAQVASNYSGSNWQLEVRAALWRRSLEACCMWNELTMSLAVAISLRCS